MLHPISAAMIAGSMPEPGTPSNETPMASAATWIGEASAEHQRHLLPGKLDGLVRAPAVSVLAGRIAEVLPQVRQHGVNDLRQHRRRRVVVQIDGLAGCHDSEHQGPVGPR